MFPKNKARMTSFVLCATLLCLCLMSSDAVAEPAESENVVLIGHLDIEGGGMVDVRDGIACIGHMKPPFATSIVDVSDPAKPTIISHIKTKPHTHSHKARMCGNTMIINREQYADSIPGYIFNALFRKRTGIGLAVYDISDPTAPRETAFLKAGGINLSNAPAGVHRFEFDCERNLAYISATAEGYRGNIVLIIDLFDPANPTEISRWWLNGQWLAGGEKPTWRRNNYHVHHPNRMGDRLYVPMWFGGFAIVDISDIKQPKTIAHMDYDHPSPTHTTLPVEHAIMGKKWLVVFDEDISDECEEPQASMWMVDITDEKNPEMVTSFQVPEGGKYSFCDGSNRKRFGAHQPHEHVRKDNLVYAAWFAGGLRIIDISNPYQPREVGFYVPEPVGEYDSPQSNDVFVDDNGLIYLIDRNNGLDILEYKGNDPSKKESRQERILIDTNYLR